MSELKKCFDELRPAMDELNRLISTAPLPGNEVAGLAVMVVAYFMGVAGTACGEANPKFAAFEDREKYTEIAQLVVNAKAPLS